jgi:hypothetical protein
MSIEKSTDLTKYNPTGVTQVEDAARPASGRSTLLRWLLTMLLAGLILASIFFDTLTTGAGAPFILQRGQTFVTIFLGIFIEAVSFLLLGSLVSGFIAVFVSQDALHRFLPRQPALATLAGVGMGLLFPVCECGVVPVTRRLFEKGLPVSVGITFLLSAPVINPIVIFSTYTAFGFGPLLWGRIVFTIVVAVVVGLVFMLAKPVDVLLPSVCTLQDAGAAPQGAHTLPLPRRLLQAITLAGDDFLDMVRYLIVGSLLAAAMQTLVPQSLLLVVGQGPVISVLVMQMLAFVLSVCSTVDAFLALAFSGAFTTGSILAFLVFGPMVDIKSSIMFLSVFQKRIVVYLIVLPFLLSLLIGVAWNLNLGL